MEENGHSYARWAGLSTNTIHVALNKVIEKTMRQRTTKVHIPHTMLTPDLYMHKEIKVEFFLSFSVYVPFISTNI